MLKNLNITYLAAGISTIIAKARQRYIVVALGGLILGGFGVLMSTWVLSIVNGTALNTSAISGLKLVRELPTAGPISTVLWNSDGSALAAVDLPPIPSKALIRIQSPYGSSVTIWSADGHVLRNLSRPEAFFVAGDKLAFVAGDKQLAVPPLLSSSSLGFSVFDIETGSVAREFAGPLVDKPRYYNRAKLLVASPDQSLLAVAFPGAQPVALYSTTNWSKLAEIPERGVAGEIAPTALAFSHDGRFLAIGRLKFIIVYDIHSKQIVSRFEVPVNGAFIRDVAFSPDGSMVAVATATMGIFGLDGGSLLSSYSDQHFDIDAAAWSPDGRFIVFLTGYRQIRIWTPLSAGASDQTITLDDWAGSLDLSRDSKKLAINVGQHASIFSITP